MILINIIRSFIIKTHAKIVSFFSSLHLSLPLPGLIQQRTNWLYFSYFSIKTGFDITSKLSPLETICMKCQILFLGKIRKIFQYVVAEKFIQNAKY